MSEEIRKTAEAILAEDWPDYAFFTVGLGPGDYPSGTYPLSDIKALAQAYLDAAARVFQLEDASPE